VLLYLAVQLHRFELRWRWVVSSLLQQIVPPRVEIVVDCATLEGDKGKLLFPSVMCPWLTYYPTPREVFEKRGYVRNEQVARARELGADWMYFTDADHVYPPRYFSALATCLSRHRRENRVLFDWTTLATTRKSADRLVAWRGEGDWIVPHAYDRAHELPIEARLPNLHAGGAMQVARMAAIAERNGGRYIHPKYRKSWDRKMFDGQRARSDWQFRATMGELRVSLDSRPKIHLNHVRDKELGHHAEEQR
jgi:hypothetical protein